MARSGTPRHCYHMVLGMLTLCPESFSCREVPQGRKCQIGYTHDVLPGGLPVHYGTDDLENAHLIEKPNIEFPISEDSFRLRIEQRNRLWQWFSL